MAIIELTRFDGMSKIFAPEKMPPILLQRIVNMELMEKEGWLKKRKGYKNVVTSGLTALKNMIEFVDRNDGRQILLLDGTTLKEIVYAAGGSGYGAVGSIANDGRPTTDTISEFHPILINNEIRSGAGISASTDKPIWYGYIAERKRFNNSITINAGKYLERQYPGWDSLIDDQSVSSYESLVSGVGLDPGYYMIFLSPVLDGYQRGFPKFAEEPGIPGAIYIEGTSKYSIKFGIKYDPTYPDNEPRLTAIDVFVAFNAAGYDAKLEKSVAYFIGRIDLNDDGFPFYRNDNATLDPAAQTITIGDITSWKTFNFQGLIVEDLTNNKEYLIQSESVASPNVTLTVDTSGRDSIPSGAISPAKIRVKSGWSKGWYYMVYDHNWVLSGSEMYDHLGIPSGDFGVSDLRYKYAAYARKRYFACGFPDKYAYYSVPYAPDVIPSQNVMRLRKDATGVVDIGDEQFIVFYKDSADLVLIVGNGDHRIDDHFLNVGCASHESIIKVSDRVVAWMDYTGPYVLQNNSMNYIGMHLKEWWYDKLTDAHKEACVGAFNRLKQWLLFSFPTYSDADYPNGIVFVFDLNAHNSGKISPWWILKTDVPIQCETLTYDLHLFTGDDTKIVDWNTTGTPDENVEANVLFKLIQNPLLGRHLNLKKMMIDFEYGANAVTANFYVDGSSTPTITVTANTGDHEKFIQYLMQNFDLEIKSSADKDDFTLKSILLFTKEKRIA